MYFLLFRDNCNNDATIPFRLLNGDSLVQEEWHLTQFASLFSFLPVYIWKAVKGSADGMFVFLRFVYLFIHTTIAVVIYNFFKKYGKWAVLAAMMFYIQIPYRIIAISYHSMFVVFLLLLTLCLLSIYKKNSVRDYIFAGVCFGCCCVSNPLFSLAFGLYLICCILWEKRDDIKGCINKRKASQSQEKEKKLTKKQKNEQQQLMEASPDVGIYDCFFSKDAILRFSCGIFMVAVIAVGFFFLTGGTINSILDNIENLLGSSEYNVGSTSIISKFATTISYFFTASLGMAWVLPAIFIALSVDKKKKSSKHRLIYLSVSVIWSLLFVVTVLLSGNGYLFAVSLPLCFVSGVCYSLTENRNKPLFYCMYIPCLIAAFFHYLAADTHLAAIGIVLVVSNVAGVFFVKDLWKELRTDSKEDSEPTKQYEWCRKLIVISFCLHVVFCISFYMYGQILGNDAVKATSGPYSGLYMSKEQYEAYSKTIDDLDYIKSVSRENDPILIASYNNWMYLYLDRPMATYSTWYRGTLDVQQLKNYYKENPGKIPEYIYIESSDPQGSVAQHGMGVASEIFYFTNEELSNGVLLTVEGCMLY